MTAVHIDGCPAVPHADVRVAWDRWQVAEEGQQAAALLLADALVDYPADLTGHHMARLQYQRARAVARDARDEYDDLYERWWHAGGPITRPVRLFGVTGDGRA